jgi:hypothetical protein
MRERRIEIILRIYKWYDLLIGYVTLEDFHIETSEILLNKVGQTFGEAITL